MMSSLSLLIPFYKRQDRKIKKPIYNDFLQLWFSDALSKKD